MNDEYDGGREADFDGERNSFQNDSCKTTSKTALFILQSGALCLRRESLTLCGVLAADPSAQREGPVVGLRVGFIRKTHCEKIGVTVY